MWAPALAILLPALPSAAQTNAAPPVTNTAAMMNGLLQIQAQLRATQLQIQKDRMEAAQAAQSNAAVAAAQVAQLEQTLARQRLDDTELIRRTQQLAIYLAATIGLACLAIILLIVYFQQRAFSQLVQVTARHAAVAAAGGVHQLAAPGQATVDASSGRLLEIVGRLEKKIVELEDGSRLIAAPPEPSAPFAEDKRSPEANDNSNALADFEKMLETQPHNAGVLAKKAAALDKLGRLEEALAFYDRAIAADDSLVIAHLQKGGLLNRMARHEEALRSYELALLAQDRKGAATRPAAAAVPS
ncbi:MAG: hypothetical protein KGJ88_10275 [Verrucomicrobiota bacterium]|nr:hypothetical protein [Verrucomicrobiota bacterium]